MEVALGLGSNRGESLATLRAAVRSLAERIEGLRVSGLYVSAPVGGVEQPDFLNACCVGRVAGPPGDLLEDLRVIERQFGRTRSPGVRNRPRTLDLDLLLFGTDVVEAPDLVIPHPRLREREFVLRPLSDLIPDRIVPDLDGGAGCTVAQLLADLPPQRIIKSRLRLEDP